LSSGAPEVVSFIPADQKRRERVAEAKVPLGLVDRCQFVIGTKRDPADQCLAAHGHTHVRLAVTAPQACFSPHGEEAE
jgi:hypothetical protein